MPNGIRVLSELRDTEHSGRIVWFIPKTVADGVYERLRHKPLSPFRVPINRLPAYFSQSYSGIMHRIEDMPVVVPKDYLLTSSKKHSMADWPLIQYLELFFSRQPGVPALRHDQLPADGTDWTSEKVAYARTMQYGLFDLGDALGLKDAQTLAELQESEYTQEYPNLDQLTPDIQDDVQQLSKVTGFTASAVIRLLLERDVSLQAGCRREGLLVLEALRHPRSTRPLRAVSKQLGTQPRDDYVHLRANRYGVATWLNEDGYPDVYVDHIAEEIVIRRKYPAGLMQPHGIVPKASKTDVNINQVIPNTNASPEMFIAWVAAHVREEEWHWLRNAKDVVLPHYRLDAIAPFVVAHRRQKKGGPPPNQTPS